jgi:hypothetical protein
MVSCGGEAKKADQNAGDQQATVTFDAGLTLNDGEKWQLDDHTRTALAAMVASGQESQLTELDQAARQNVAVELQQGIAELVQGCTMSGPDHEALHAFLGGYIPAVAALAEWGRVEDAQEVQYYLEISSTYFK